MIPVDWNLLRAIDGSQQNGFEELCAQLAAGEDKPTDASFVRRAPPDAGIECYWVLANGDIHAWQAKFFREIPKKSQWEQIKDSVQKALSKHPRLKEYTICFPIDRSDAVDPNRQSFMDQWNRRVEKWQVRARDLGMSVRFAYWGQFEILERLSLEKHNGRFFFWFNKDAFDASWFSAKLNVAIANAGRRYHPELNVSVPVSRSFRGLGHTPEFFLELQRAKGEIRRRLDDAANRGVEKLCPNESSQLREAVGRLVQALDRIDPAVSSALPLELLHDTAREGIRIAAAIADGLRDAEAASRSEDDSGTTSSRYVSRNDQYYLHRLDEVLDQLATFTRSAEALLANTAKLLLVGSAGVGKTHLFCEVAREREKAARLTLLLLGEQFSQEEPWGQILRRLDVSCTTDEFLGALNSAGESQRCRTLILIDALNEGEGIHLWPKHLAGFLAQLERYPWIGIAVSIRQTYLQIAADCPELIRVFHRGFVGLESVAVTRFFAHYGIATPGVPLLQPEFSNPLFLTLFCEGLENRGMRHVPDGLEGITAVFDFFLDSINGKLSRPSYLDFDPPSRLVHRAVEAVTELMVAREEQWLPRAIVDQRLQELHPSIGWERSLLRHMLNEGLLSEDLYEREPVVRFSYERLTDHQMAKFYLARFLNLSDPVASFAPGTRLGSKVGDELACWDNAGLVAALAIQLPELTGRELPDLAPHCAVFQPVLDAMVESLVWRKHTAFTARTLDYVNRHLIQREHRALLRTLVTVSTQPGHPYNARLLHRNLLRRPMPERDADWSLFVHDDYWEEQSPVRRLIEWAEVDEVKAEGESLALIGITLAWFLSSSNRFLRDRATKCLVRLFAAHVPLLCQVLNEFRTVDDMYVLERLLAVAYGCAMRSLSVEHLRALATWCYDAIFRAGARPHILLHDYARGVIERAIHRGADLDIDRLQIQPPYGSTWPRNIPSEKKLEPLGDWRADDPKVHSAQLAIYSSVMSQLGDFASYVIGTNSGRFEWEAIRLNEPRPPSPTEVREGFLRSLTPKQSDLWRRLEELERASWARTLSAILARPGVRRTPRGAPGERRRIAAVRRELSALLDPGQRRVFRLLGKRGRGRVKEHSFDLRLVQRFVLNRVFELGWTADRFGEFDRNVSSEGRKAHKAERIGKKYQWLAYHEALARVSDNFIFRKPFSEQPGLYQGTWQIGVRDIDPSITIRKTHRPGYRSMPRVWWVPMEYSDWRSTAEDEDWLRKLEDVPRIQNAVRVIDPADGSRWLTLEGDYHWDEPIPVDREFSEVPTRTIWFRLKSYIVRQADLANVFDWARRQEYWGLWMPESSEVYDVFAGEFFWSPAYRDECNSLRGESAWDEDVRDHGLPVPVVVTAQQFLCGGGSFDCSVDDSVSFFQPSPWLAESLGLRWGGREGEHADATGEIVARDPSVFAAGPGVLLVRVDALRAMLRRLDCRIFWTVLGAKEVMRPHLQPCQARNEFSGALTIRNRVLEGRIVSRFKDFTKQN